MWPLTITLAPVIVSGMASCASCGSENDAGARFCDQCGSRLASACASCGAELRPEAKFCSECGATAAPAPAIPARPAGAVRSASPVSERKVTSVLFGDLVGFTSLSEKRDKEDVRELLSEYFAQCRRIVTRYGGTIEKFIGDAVMAVWGVPAAHEDDAERAVRAGLELVRAIESLEDQLGLPGLRMRVGIVTGEVAVTVGAEYEGMVAGDAVNTAARVQSVAEPGQVWVDEGTRLLTSGAITYADEGSHELKGKAEPVPLWAVRAVVAAVGGQQRADGLEAPLTGRIRELRVIKELFHAVDETRRPALVLVNGDPGLGKSRLAWEFEKYIDGLYDTVAWHSTRCLPYGDGVAYWPIAEAVRGRLGLVESEQDVDPAAALDSWLAAQVPDETERAWIRPRLLALLGRASSGGYDSDDLFAAWRTFFERAGGADPVALVVDDAQHADDGTMRFVEHVLANADAPLFVMLLARPGLLERWPDLATNRRATVLHLATLEPRELAAMLDGLVTGLPEDVRDGLVKRAQGVPLYAIETIRSLIDRDLVVPRGGVYVLPDPSKVDVATIGAPASLQALVAARLDGLTPTERRVVTDASVLGTTFTREAIGALSTDVADLDDVLTSLSRAEVLSTVSSRLSAEYGQYRFVQEVVRQVAYNTQSRRDRKARHLAVAGYFADLDPSSDNASVLAQHYLEAIDASAETDVDVTELREQVTSHLSDAATRAIALGAARDAQRYLDTALLHATDDESTAQLHHDAAWVAFELSDADNAEAHARAAMEVFETIGDRIRLGSTAAVLAMSMGLLRNDNAACIAIAMPHWEELQGVRGAEEALLRLARAIGIAGMNLNDVRVDVVMERVAIAESIADRAALAAALGSLATAMMHRTPTLAGILIRGAADIGRAEGLPRVAIKALGNLANITLMSSLTESLALTEQSLEETRRSGVEAYNVMVYGINLASRWIALGDWNGAEEVLAGLPMESFAATMVPWLDAMLAQRQGRPRKFASIPDEARASDDETIIAYTASYDMYAARARGDLDAATALGLDAVRRLIRVVGLLDDTVFVWPESVETAFVAGDADALAELLAYVDDAPPGLVGLAYRGHRARLAALMAIRDGVADGVERHFAAAIGAYEEWGSPAFAARARAELARWLDDHSRPEDAARLRQAALEVLVPLRANGWLTALGLDPAPEPDGSSVDLAAEPH